MTQELFQAAGLLKYRQEENQRSFLPEKELKNKIREIRKEMRSYNGEFFLAVERDWRFHGCTGFGYKPRDEDYQIDEITSLGICQTPYIQEEDDLLKIQTERYVWAAPAKIWVEDKPLGHLLAYELEASLPPKGRGFSSRDSDPGVSLRIIVGDTQVTQWFIDKSLDHINEDQKSVLKAAHPGTFLEEIEKRRNTEPLINYFKLQKALGRILDQQPEEVQTALRGLKLKLVDQLLALSRQDSKLSQEIGRIYQVPSQGGILFEDGGGVTLIEDEDDARVVSLGARMRLGQVRQQALSIMEEAFEFEMHKTPDTMRREIRPGQTIEIDVPKLIHDFCQFYEIPIPQN